MMSCACKTVLETVALPIGPHPYVFGLSRTSFGADGGSRTPDHLITKQTLWPLSYAGVEIQEPMERIELSTSSLRMRHSAN